MSAALDPYPSALRSIVADATDRIERRVTSHAPTVGRQLAEWTRGLAGGAEPAAYFTHPDAFPMLLLPWWLEAAATGRDPEPAFHRELAYSTVSGYWFVRLVDDVMDGEPVPRGVLPALIVLHAEFLAPFRGWFPAGHPFWAAFDDASFAAAETAARDTEPRELTRAEFERTSARKVAGAVIPIAAACHHLDRPELLPDWARLVELLGRWHQLLNDVQGWPRDHDAGRPTYFLAEAARHRGTAVADWVVAGGLHWAVGTLDAWMGELLDLAGDLGSAPLAAWLDGRRLDVERRWREVEPGLASLRRLADTLG